MLYIWVIVFLCIINNAILCNAYQYPKGSLPCKLYNHTQVDCTHRQLVTIPPLHGNATTTLDLSNNNLQNISGFSHFMNLGSLQTLKLSLNSILSMDSKTFRCLHLLVMLKLNKNKLMVIDGSPFQCLASLQKLDLSHNGDLKKGLYLSGTAFNGLQRLVELDLSNCYIDSLENEIFIEVPNLQNLDLSDNILTTIPSQALAVLMLLENLDLSNNNALASLECGMEFLNLTSLEKLDLMGNSSLVNISNRSFQFLSNSPLQKVYLTIQENTCIDTRIFEPLKYVTYFEIDQEYTPIQMIFSHLQSLHSPLEHLVLSHSNAGTKLNTTSLEPLAKWNQSLNQLEISSGSGCEVRLQTIDDDAFSWLPHLTNLVFKKHYLIHFSNNAFRGLPYLQVLDLSNNHIAFLPSSTLKMFQNHTHLKHLDLSHNDITNLGTHGIIDITIIALIPSLIQLNLSHNKFKGIKVESHKPASVLNLAELNLKKLKHSFVFAAKFPLLSTLDIASIPADPKPHTLHIPYRLCDVSPNITTITINNWILDGSIFEAFGKTCSKLKTLDISNTDFLNNGKNQSDQLYTPNLKTLKLTHNNIKSVSQMGFLKSHSLQSLDLSYNDIETIQDEEAVTFLRNLTFLNLENNRIVSASWLHNLEVLETLNLAKNSLQVVSKDILSRKNLLVMLDLGNNPFDCSDCGSESFQSWIKKDNLTFLKPDLLYQCSTPKSSNGQSVTSVNLGYCRYLLVIYICSAFLSFLTMCTIVFLLMHYRWHIKYKLFLMFHRRQYQRFNSAAVFDENANELGSLIHRCRYDAYVVYAEEDKNWVNDELVPNIEGGTERFQLCMKERGDIPPGGYLLDAVCHGIKHSRKSIILLSDHFMADGMCDFQLQIARMRLIDEGRDVVILVFLEDIPDGKKTMLLRQMLCQKDCLRWPQGNVGRDLFWRRLREELKMPVRVDRRYEIN